MSRTVMCRKYHEELPGLDRPPYPGAKGEDIWQRVAQGLGRVAEAPDHADQRGVA